MAGFCHLKVTSNELTLLFCILKNDLLNDLFSRFNDEKWVFKKVGI